MREFSTFVHRIKTRNYTKNPSSYLRFFLVNIILELYYLYKKFVRGSGIIVVIIIWLFIMDLRCYLHLFIITSINVIYDIC